MTQEKNGILREGEALWDVALRGIGIQLPDEYVLRFCGLVRKANEVGLDKVTLHDFVDIEFDARQTVERRIAELCEQPRPRPRRHEDGGGTDGGGATEDGKPDLTKEPIGRLMNEVDRLDALNRDERQKQYPGQNCQKKGHAVRMANVCKYEAKVDNVAGLLAVGYVQFVRMRNMGKQCADIVTQALKNLYGIEAW